jgi:hypothetical protein
MPLRHAFRRVQVGSRADVRADIGVDQASLDKASKLIADHNQGIAALQAHMHDIVRDLNIIKDSRKPKALMVLR